VVDRNAHVAVIVSELVRPPALLPPIRRARVRAKLRGWCRHIGSRHRSSRPSPHHRRGFRIVAEGHREPSTIRNRARRKSLAGLVLSTIEGAYIRGVPSGQRTLSWTPVNGLLNGPRVSLMKAEEGCFADLKSMLKLPDVAVSTVAAHFGWRGQRSTAIPASCHRRERLTRAAPSRHEPSRSYPRVL
jgi:hypothetical protein